MNEVIFWGEKKPQPKPKTIPVENNWISVPLPDI